MISPISSTKVNYQSFKGIPVEAPRRTIYNADDAIAQYEIMRHPKYTEIFQENEEPTKEEFQKAKQIRDRNYYFLDDLKSDQDKVTFIRYFKNLTGFPILKKSTQKVLDEFNRILNVASKNMDNLRASEHQNSEDNGILMAGYDEFCSVGQNSAIPGSDLDKAFAVVVGPEYISDKYFSDLFKGEIWNNLDNRILSVNHCAAFPNIVTLNELSNNLQKADSYASKFLVDNNPANFWQLRNSHVNLLSGARFNIWLSEQIPSFEEKEEIKNLAYIVEAMRDGIKIKDISTDTQLGCELYLAMQDSQFAQFSNIIQSTVMQDNYFNALLSKDALNEISRVKEEMEKHFKEMPDSKRAEIFNDVFQASLTLGGNSFDEEEFKNLAVATRGLKLKDIMADKQLLQRFYELYLILSTPVPIKEKLRARKDMERNFEFMPISKQYEVVKEVIKSMSGDSSNPEYINMFEGKPDKHRLLLNDILRGKVICSFEDLPDGDERIHLMFPDYKTGIKYWKVNI